MQKELKKLYHVLFHHPLGLGENEKVTSTARPQDSTTARQQKMTTRQQNITTIKKT